MPPTNRSYQNSIANANKAAKFINANPLAPIADPFSRVNDDGSAACRAELAKNINTRLEAAVADLGRKYKSGKGGGDDDPDRAPTGAIYRQEEARRAVVDTVEAQAAREAKERREREEFAKFAAAAKAAEVKSEEKDSDDEYDALLNELDDDPAVEALRRRRIEEMRTEQVTRAENLGKGHGQYRTIAQDEFLKECIASTYVVCHFYSGDFQRCKILDHHLQIIAKLHIECKFIRIDATKAPFFVSKLVIKTLPTLLVFKEGKVVDRLTGFEGLTLDPSDPDKWHTGKLQQWLSSEGAINYTIPNEEIQEEMKRLGIRFHGSIWSSEKDIDED